MPIGVGERVNCRGGSNVIGHKLKMVANLRI